VTQGPVTPSRNGFVASRGEYLLFLLLLLLHLVPIWSSKYFPTTDGPAHLYNAWLANTLLTDAQHPFHHFFAFNSLPIPNYTGHAILMALLTVLPPWLAEKGVLSLCALGLPLAVRYMVRAWQPTASFLSLLAFPFVYSTVFQYGFYNFCLSLILLLVVVGFWRRHLYASPLSWKPIAGLAGLLLLLYFSHPLTYLVTGMLLGLFVLERAWSADAADRGRQLRTGLLSLLLASIPSLLLLGWYFLAKQEPMESIGSSAPQAPVGKLIHDWFLLEPLRFMGSAEGSYRLVLAFLLFGLVGYAVWRHTKRQTMPAGKSLVAASGLLVVAYALLPDALAGGSIVRPRLGLISYLLLLGFLATVDYPQRLRQAVVGIGVVVAVLFLGFRYGKYQTLATGLDEYLSAGTYIRPGSSLAVFTYAQVTRMPNGKDYKSYIDVFPHAASYLSVERRLMNFENYEAATGYFPLLWKPNRALLTDNFVAPARFELASYPRQQWPTYVLLWGRLEQPDSTSQPGNDQRVQQQLRQHYHVVYRSPTRLLTLYEQVPRS
jgi:hypothetical protein